MEKKRNNHVEGSCYATPTEIPGFQFGEEAYPFSLCRINGILAVRKQFVHMFLPILCETPTRRLLQVLRIGHSKNENRIIRLSSTKYRKHYLSVQQMFQKRHLRFGCGHTITPAGKQLQRNWIPAAMIRQLDMRVWQADKSG